MKMAIRSTITIAGTHNWPGAHDSRAYLRSEHRHLFHIAVTARVAHNERDIEFHDLAQLVSEALHSLFPTATNGLALFGANSCESIGQILGTCLIDQGVPVICVTVSEDGEFDSIIEWESP